MEGIGGVFLYANDAKALSNWYAHHFGISVETYEDGKVYGTEFKYRRLSDSSKVDSTVWSISQSKEPLPAERRECQVNYRVRDLPAFLEQLKADRTLWPQAVDEILRIDSPIQMTSRTALEDVEVQGQAFAKGTTLMLLIGCANRDPKVFTDPAVFDIHREATVKVIRKAMRNEPSIDWLLENQDKVEHDFHRQGLEGNL